MLVGGFGTRLHPLTLTIPKQMLVVAGRPMIEHAIAALVRHGVTRVVLSLGYRDDVFRLAYPDGRCAGAELVCVSEPEPLGTAGAIRYAWEAAGEPGETFLAVNGDVITDLTVTELVRRHKQTGAAATIHLIPTDDPSRYGVVVTDRAGRVVDFVEKPPVGKAPSRWINAGTYVMEPSVIDRIPAHGPVSVERDTFPSLAAEGSLWAWPEDVYWIDAGTPESYLRVQWDLLEGRRRWPWPDGEQPPAHRSPAGVSAHIYRSSVASSSKVGIEATVDRSVIMDGASIGVGARIVRSVVMNGATIGPYVLVDSSVVGPKASVGPGATLMDVSLVGEGAAVGAGERLRSVRRSNPRRSGPRG